MVILLLTISLYPQSSLEDNYTPMTGEQAIEWLRSVSAGDLVSLVIDWDYIEHTAPDIPYPDYVCLITEDSIVLTPYYENGISDIYSHGYLSYDIEWPVLTYDNNVSEPFNSFNTYLVIGTVSLAVGTVLGLIISSKI